MSYAEYSTRFLHFDKLCFGIVVAHADSGVAPYASATSRVEHSIVLGG